MIIFIILSLILFVIKLALNNDDEYEYEKYILV